MTATFNNSHQTTNSERSNYSPQLQSTFRVQATQHLLQGFGPWINGRFIMQAKNDRRITDSAFRQQLLYTVNQVENIYWGLVSAYEDEQAKERALTQSTQLAADNRKQLEIGTLAPLDVVNSDSAVATDKQALVASKSNLEYQQLIMKQAIARNLEDPRLSTCAGDSDGPGGSGPAAGRGHVGGRPGEAGVCQQSADRAGGVEHEEQRDHDQGGEERPAADGGCVCVLRGKRTGRIAEPVPELLDVSGLGPLQPCPPGQVPGVGYGTVFTNLFNNTSPDKGVGVNINIPLRNRVAQADQARSQMEYRQSQMRLQQLYTQIRIQVINGQYALTNDRAQVQAAQAARDFAAQSLDAEQKKYRLGASTTALVLQQGRNLAGADNNLISATAAYAKDRSALGQLLSNTLDRYGISITGGGDRADRAGAGDSGADGSDGSGTAEADHGDTASGADGSDRSSSANGR